MQHALTCSSCVFVFALSCFCLYHLQALGRLSRTATSFHYSIGHKHFGLAFQRHASALGISHTLVPSSWKKLIRGGVVVTSSVLQAAFVLLHPVWSDRLSASAHKTLLLSLSLSLADALSYSLSLSCPRCSFRMIKCNSDTHRPSRSMFDVGRQHHHVDHDHILVLVRPTG